jgi:hypothetical protein
MERRKFPRYLAKVKAYFPGDPTAYTVENISWKGLFIKAPHKFDLKKRLIYFELDIPEIGRIPIYGYIVHQGTNKNPGIGIEIVEIDKNLAHVWGLYIKALNYLKEAREEYERRIQEETKKGKT